MNKKAIKFAVKHTISLGQWVSGHGSLCGFYYIVDHTDGCSTFGGQRVSHVSMQKNGKSAIIMMKRYLREQRG